MISPSSLMSGSLDAEIYAAQQCIDNLAKAGFVCTTQTEIDKLVFVVFVFAFLTGIAATMLFQYFRRKARERIETGDAAAVAKLRGNSGE